MNTKNAASIEHLGDGSSRIWFTTEVDGQPHSWVHVSGPTTLVQAYFDGKLDFDGYKRAVAVWQP